MWWCPDCKRFRRELEESCPTCGTLAEDHRLPPDRRLLEARRPERDVAVTGRMLEEREPVELPRDTPWAYGFAALFIATAGLEHLVRWLAARPQAAMAIGAVCLLALLAMGLLARYRPERARIIARAAARVLVRPVAALRPRARRRHRLVVQRSPEGDLVGVEIEAPAPWPPPGQGEMVRITGRWLTPQLLRADQIEPAEPVPEGWRVITRPAAHSQTAWAAALVAVYLLIAAALR